jgi:predicted dehydrogenase
MGCDRFSASRSRWSLRVLTISVGHTLDLVEAVLGAIVEVDARTEILWPTVKLTDLGEESSRDTADHLDVLAKTRSGAVVTADINAGVAPQDIRSSFEIRGTEGWLSLTSDHPYSFQAGDLKLTSNVSFETPEEAAVSGGHGRGDQRRRGLCSSCPRCAGGNLSHTRL